MFFASNKVKFIRIAHALAASAAIATLPVSAQVSSALLGTATGSGVVGNALDALKQGQVGTAAVGNTPASADYKAATGGKVGTFTLSASEGTSQNFAVGTATNLGINASASSTSEYQVKSDALLGLAGSSFRQVIGTSGTAENTATRTAAKNEYVASAVETEVGSSAESYFNKKLAASTSASGTCSGWWGCGQTYTQASAVQENNTGKLQTEYNSKLTAVTQRATSEFTSTSAFSEAANGVIRGTFNASETSDVDTGAKATREVSTTIAAGGKDSKGNTYAAGGTEKITFVDAADANSSSTKQNQVEVKGIGNAANVNFGGSSTFTTGVSVRPTITTPTSNSATANGAAGSNIQSTSNANASNSSFSSVFVQSF